MLNHSSPAWKLKICIEAMKVRPIDLSSLAKETSVMFASNELVEMAACCLEEITAEMTNEEAEERHASSSLHIQKAEKKESSQQILQLQSQPPRVKPLVTKPPVPMQKLQGQLLLQNRRLLIHQMPSHPMRRRKTLTKVFLSRKSPRHGLTEWSMQAIVFCGHRALCCP